MILVRTWRALAALQARQRTTRRPRGSPPLATSRTWSAVRSADWWAGWRPHPGHQSPTMARWSATTRARRRRSAWSLWRSGRLARLARSFTRWQSTHLGLPRTGREQPRQGRMRFLIVACGWCGGGVRWHTVGSGRRRRWGVGSRCRPPGLAWPRWGQSSYGSYPRRQRRVRRTGVGRPAWDRTPTTPAPL